MVLEKSTRTYQVLNKKMIKSKDGKEYFKLSLYNENDDDFRGLFVKKDIFDKCVKGKITQFNCNITIYGDGKVKIDILNVN